MLEITDLKYASSNMPVISTSLIPCSPYFILCVIVLLV